MNTPCIQRKTLTLHPQKFVFQISYVKSVVLEHGAREKMERKMESIGLFSVVSPLAILGYLLR